MTIFGFHSAERIIVHGFARRAIAILLAVVLLIAGLFAASSPVAAGTDAISWGGIANGPSGAWHRLAKLPDGSWLRVLTTFPSSGRSELHVYKSTDAAQTWTEISSVNDGQRLVDNGFLYMAPNGDVLLAGRNLVNGSSYKISQWRSTDYGQSWVREPDVVSVTGSKGVYEPFYYGLPDGRTVLMWSDETYKNTSQVIAQKVSTDYGHTWGVAKVVVSDGKNGRPGMPGVARMANGQYIFTYEVCGTRNCNVYNKKSSDGVTWANGIGSQIPGAVCGPFVTAASDGKTYVTACRVSDTNYTTPILYSNDNGITWQTNTPAFTDAGQYGEWPALYQIDGSHITSVNGYRMRFGTLQSVL